MYEQLSEKEQIIILQILKSGPQNQYQLKTGISRYATIQTILKRLSEKKALTLKEEKDGVPKKTWYLTLEGFSMAMKTLQARGLGLSYVEFDSMVSAWKELAPLIQLLPTIKQRLSLEEATRFIKFAPVTLSNRKPFTDSFAGPIVYAFLDDFKENADSTRYWENNLREEGVFDMLSNDATALGLKADFSNTRSIVQKFLNSEKWNRYEHIEGKDRFVTYAQALGNFIIYLEAKEKESLQTKWIPVFKDIPLLAELFKYYVEEAEEKAAAETLWVKDLIN